MLWALLISVRAVASSPVSTIGQPSPAAKPRNARAAKGITPFNEALKRGDIALIARDIDTALSAYREAIDHEPENAVGHYRIAEAEIEKGDLAEADAAVTAGLRVVGSDWALKAKLQFVLADLQERRHAFEPALAEWSNYQTTSLTRKEARTFPDTAVERKNAILAWRKLGAEAAEVKARIEKRLAEADEAVRNSSK